MDRIENVASNNSSIVACVFVHAPFIFLNKECMLKTGAVKYSYCAEHYAMKACRRNEYLIQCIVSAIHGWNWPALRSVRFSPGVKWIFWADMGVAIGNYTFVENLVANYVTDWASVLTGNTYNSRSTEREVLEFQ
jgi:hypothetical protein